MANKQNDDYHTEEEDEMYDSVESKYNDEKENASNYNDEENQIRTPRKQFEVNKDTMDAMDLDGDGKVSNEEMNMKVTIEKAWQKFDEDGNGVITKQELVKILKANHMASSDKEVMRKADTIMAQADKDGDGVVDYNEFVDFAYRDFSDRIQLSDIYSKIISKFSTTEIADAGEIIAIRCCHCR